MKLPTDKAAVERLRGTVNYLSRFVPKLSAVLRPISVPTHPDVEWTWDSVHDKAFEEIKRLLTQAPVLAYFDSTKELSIQCDASGQGLGAALLQEGRPLAYASRALAQRYRNKVRNHREGDARHCIRSREVAPIHLWSSRNRPL